ncbi:MAG: NYN domain-containing protein [Gemmatimonadaceae bacterium]|nr:NYN domain-containing protein [Gemmatimonadaceae bacterium]
MRIRFLVDGFNLYHSVKAAERHLGAGPLRWLDIHAMCTTIVRSSFGPGYAMDGIHYFSALARHLESKKPDVVRRHLALIAALEARGVDISLADFKRKQHIKNLSEMRMQIAPFKRWLRIPARTVRLSYQTHEEKETDVAIACKLMELLALSRCDGVALVTGDTDLAPAIRTARRLYPGAEIAVVFPFHRHNRELERLATRHVKIGARQYQSHQFPASFRSASGVTITKPAEW